MMLNKEEREEFSKLSKEIFGTRSKWQKILKHGHSELLTRTVVEEVAGEDGELTQKEKQEPILTSNGSKQFTVKRYTEESLKEYMLLLKSQRDEIIATINKQNQERKEKEAQEKLAKELQENNGGSAV